MKSYSVLIAEDDRDVIETLEAMLQAIGVTDIATETDGRSAVNSALSNNPDILLLDLNLPGLDGLEVIEHISAADFAGSIVILSGEQNDILEAAGLAASAAGLEVLGVLPKPFEFDDFRRLVYRRKVATPKKLANKPEKLTRDEIEIGLKGLAPALHLLYQPKVCVETGAIKGVEALSRWIHPKRGILPPAQFLDEVEKYGFNVPLTNAVIARSIQQLGEWHADGHLLKMSINVSLEDLRHDTLVDTLMAFTKVYDVDPKYVTVEVLENQVMKERHKPISTLARLRLKGFGIAIDDFGVGASTIAQLKQVPCTELKIDKLFVQSESGNEQVHKILEFCVNLGRNLNLNLVAEGVESEFDLALVKKLNCDEYQGFYLAKPLSPQEVIELYKQKKTAAELRAQENDLALARWVMP